MIPYRTNNVEFRIASASAIGKFKSIQANSFLQVSRKEFAFNTAAREVVLLSYDRFSYWLFRIERRFLIEEQRQVPSEYAVNSTIAAFTAELLSILDVCKANPTVFDPGVTAFLEVIHRYSVITFTESVLREARVPGAARMFIAVTDIITDYLQHVLIAMHEFNNNVVLKKRPILCIGQFCLRPYTEKFAPVLTRAKFFLERDPNAVFILKNFINENISEECIQILTESGIRALPENSETVASG